tara:strand:- start:5244 stop:8495 length:3252 start_codon:yes stop_codon:yes gene_type:complete
MITIQLLDYKYRKNNTDLDENNLINFNNVTTLPSNCKIENISEITWSSLGVNSYIYPVAGILSNGSQYELELTVSNYAGVGDIGFSPILTDTTVDIPADARRSSNGTTVGSAFTCHTSTGAPRLFCDANTSGSITAKLVRRNTILEDTSIKGVLEVGNSEDFPLALNFSIADIRNLNARTGTYSKTFKIPATKNNNIILKSCYNIGAIVNGNTVSGKKPCNIVVDGVYSIPGLLEVTVIGQSDAPLYYSCVFYGNNIGWTALIENQLLKDLRVSSHISLSGANAGEIVQGAPGSGWDNLNGKGVGTGVGLNILHGATDQYAATASNTGTVPVPPVVGIVDTWNIDNVSEATPYNGATVPNTSPVVYTNVGYGERNTGGKCVTQQLLRTATTQNGWSSTKTGCFGWDSNNNSYGTPLPSCDWRPGIFIYDIIKQIFAQVGYRVSSTFIETDMFKKLIMLLPNFKYNNSDDRRYDYSAAGSFINSGSPIAQIESVVSLKLNVGPYSANPSVNASWPGWIVDFDNDGNYAESLAYSNSIYSSNNGVFAIEEAGFYDLSSSNIGMNVDSFCVAGSTTSKMKMHYIRLYLQVKTVGETSWNGIASVDSGFTNLTYNAGCPAPPLTTDIMGAFPNIEVTQYLNKGDQVRWLMRAKISHFDVGNQDIGINIRMWGGNPYLDTGTGFVTNDASGKITCEHQSINAEWGQTYDLKNVIDSESTQLDFLRGVIHAFNLYLTTDVSNKLVTIEPFFYSGDDAILKAAISNFFYNQNTALDWTSKLDLSRAQEDKFIESKLSNELIFKYKTDSNDKKVESRGIQYWDGILDEFPYKEIIGGESKVGTTTYENPFFAGCYNGKDGTISGDPFCSPGGCSWVPYSSLLWGECDTTPPSEPTYCSGCRPPKGYDFLPRIVNYVKDGYDVRPTSVFNSYKTEIEVWGNSTYTIAAGIPTSYPGTIIYPILTRAMSHDKFPNYTNPPPVLTYASTNNSRFNPALPTTSYALRFDKGLYQTYYQIMIEMLKKTTRMKEAYLNLKISDIQSLDLRRLVAINGYYYRINKIIDFKPNNNELTKVELLLWEDVGSFPATYAPGF